MASTYPADVVDAAKCSKANPQQSGDATHAALFVGLLAHADAADTD